MSPKNPARKQLNEQNLTPGTALLFTIPEEYVKSDRMPTHRGKMYLQRDYKKGDPIQFAAWIKTGSNGKPYIVLKEDTRYKDWVDEKKQEKQDKLNAPHEVPVGYAREKKREDYDIDEDSVPF